MATKEQFLLTTTKKKTIRVGNEKEALETVPLFLLMIFKKNAIRESYH